jgi:hypothetical protein
MLRGVFPAYAVQGKLGCDACSTLYQGTKVSFMNEQTVFLSTLFDVLSTILCMQIGLRCHKNYSFKVVLEKYEDTIR